MSVSIHNTWGGYNTKDADAVPGDVRDGKTFYNTDGRQTGIWTPEIKEMEKSFSITIGERNGAVLKSGWAIQYLINVNKIVGSIQMDSDMGCPSGNGTNFYFSSLDHEISAFTGVSIFGSFFPLWAPGPGVLQEEYYIQFQSEEDSSDAKFRIKITPSYIEAFYGGMGGNENDSESYYGQMLMVHYV